MEEENRSKASGEASAEGSGAVRADGADRVRSHHHRHRHHHRHGVAFLGETEAEARRSQDFKILFWLVPWSVFAVGLALLFGATRQPDPTLRANGLVSLGGELTAVGAVLVVAVFCVSVWRKSRERAERRRLYRGSRHSHSGSRHGG